MSFIFISIGLSFDTVKGLYWTFIAVVAAFAFIGMIAGCGIDARIMGLARERSALVGLVMCGRCSLELALVGDGFASGIIGEESFYTVVIVSLLTIVSSPLLFKWGLWRLGPASTTRCTSSPIRTSARGCPAWPSSSGRRLAARRRPSTRRHGRWRRHPARTYLATKPS